MPSGTLRRVYPIYKNEVQLGPFTAGLDIEIDPQQLPANALQECVNYTITESGILNIRPSVYAHNQTTLGFPAATNATIASYGLGSVVGATGQLIAFAVQIIFISYNSGTNRATYNINFYKFNPTSRTWVTAFTTITFTSVGSQLTAIEFTPRGITYYNGKYWLATATGKLLSSASSTGTLTEIDNAGVTPPTTNNTPPNWGADGSGVPIGLVGPGPIILKDRMIVVDPNNLYWSGVGDPTYYCTTVGVGGEPAATGTGGVYFASKEDGELIQDFCVFDDAIYLFKSASIWKFSWTSDPSVAGDLIIERVSDEIGAVDHEIFDNELYVANGRGLYKLINSYFTEISAPVRSIWRGILPASIPNSNSGFIYILNGFGINKVGNYLLCGPFNSLGTQRADETVTDGYTGNFYLVYSFDTGLWTSWQFSADAVTAPVSGPLQKPMPSGKLPSAPFEYIWFGQTLDAGVYNPSNPMPRLQNPFSMLLSDLTNLNNLSGVDQSSLPNGTLTYKWIGNILKTGAVTLGDNTKWKRIFNCLVNCMTGNISAFLTKESILGYELDGATTAAPVVFPQANRLPIGAGYRFHNLVFIYDSITGNNSPSALILDYELSQIQQIMMEISISQKDIQ